MTQQRQEVPIAQSNFQAKLQHERAKYQNLNCYDGLCKQVESWRIVSWPDQGDHMLSLWCGKLPVLDYAGGLVMSRQRNGRGIPQKTLDEFKRVAARFGITWDMMCENNNDLCPV